MDFASLNQELAAVLFADRAPDFTFEISVLEARDDCIFDAVNCILKLAGLSAGALWDWFHACFLPSFEQADGVDEKSIFAMDVGSA